MAGITVTVACPADPECLEALAAGLVELNIAQLAQAEVAGVDCPSIYDCGAIYRREPRGAERWQSIAEMMQRRPPAGDCEDLAAWRVAELARAGEDARVRIVRTSRGSYHAIVERGDGSTEDPSRELHDAEKGTR
jgi:hypothetical protein